MECYSNCDIALKQFYWASFSLTIVKSLNFENYNHYYIRWNHYKWWKFL